MKILLIVLLLFTSFNQTALAQSASTVSLFSHGSELGSGWKSLDWFGYYYYTSSTGWLYHLNHGWIYQDATSFDSVWFYSSQLGWVWCSQSVYPWCWFNSDQSWKYFNKETDKWMVISSDSNNLPKTRSVSFAANLEMIWVEPGTFMMGSPTTEPGRNPILSSWNEAQHLVTLTQGFYLGKYEVTQAQYEAVMTGNTDGLSATPSYFSNNPNRPVEKVSWNDIQVFLTRLNQGDSPNIPAGWAYVLPTEAQWEYACRAGTTTAYSWGNSISSSNANYGMNILSTIDVGQYSPNAWGFFDMHGNVWEFVADWHRTIYPDRNAVTDPSGWASGMGKVIRGGSYFRDGADLRSANRLYDYTDFRGKHNGFRLSFQKVQ